MEILEYRLARFDLTTRDLYFMILVKVFTNHVLGKTHFTNHVVRAEDYSHKTSKSEPNYMAVLGF